MISSHKQIRAKFRSAFSSYVYAHVKGPKILWTAGAATLWMGAWLTLEIRFFSPVLPCQVWPF